MYVNEKLKVKSKCWQTHTFWITTGFDDGFAGLINKLSWPVLSLGYYYCLTLNKGFHSRILSFPAGGPPLPELPAGMMGTCFSSTLLLSSPSLFHPALHPKQTDILITHHRTKAATQQSTKAHTQDRTILLFLHGLLGLHLFFPHFFPLIASPCSLPTSYIASKLHLYRNLFHLLV